MTLNDRQLEFNGLLAGAGTEYGIREVTGLDEPAVRSSDVAVADQHGVEPGEDYLEGRAVLVHLNIVERDRDAMAAKAAALAAAFARGRPESWLRFQVPTVAGGGTRRLMCRPRRGAATINREQTFGVVRKTIELFASDPLIYGDTEQAASGQVRSEAGGLQFPAVEPFVFGGVGDSGTILAVNDGNFVAPLTLTIAGPVAGTVTIENVTVGLSYVLAGVDLGPGDTLTIDTRRHTVKLNGTANRYGWLVSPPPWWSLAPGVNELRFFASTQTTATLTATWRPAWDA